MVRSANCVYLTSLFLVLLQLILMVLVERSAYNLWKINNDDEFFTDLEKSMREPLLIGLYTSNSSCKSDSLISQYWESTDGCYCMKTKELNEGVCSSDEIANFCVNIKRKSNVYKIWKGKFICKKQVKYSYNNYFDFVKSTGECPSSHPKKCGILDDVGHYLCLKDDEICPINDIKVVTDYSKEKYTAYEAIPLGSSDKDDNLNTTLIYSNRNTQGKIVSVFKVSEGQPCYKRNIMNSPSIQSFYKLAVTTQNQCDELNQDKNFIILDTYNNRNFFSENVIPELRESLSIDFANSNPIHLFYRNYIGIKTTFTSNFDEDNFKTNMVENIFNCLGNLNFNKKRLVSTHLSTFTFLFFSVYAILNVSYLGLMIYILISLRNDVSVKEKLKLEFGKGGAFAFKLLLLIFTFAAAEITLIFALVFKHDLGNVYQIFRNGFSVSYTRVMDVKLDNLDILKMEPFFLCIYLTLSMIFSIMSSCYNNLLYNKLDSGVVTLSDPLRCLSFCASIFKKPSAINHMRLPETQLTTTRSDNSLNL